MGNAIANLNLGTSNQDRTYRKWAAEIAADGPDAYGNTLLHQIALNQLTRNLDGNQTLRLITCNAAITTLTPFGTVPAHEFYRSRDEPRLYQVAVRAGIDVNARNAEGNTVLHCLTIIRTIGAMRSVSVSGQLSIYKFLLDNGASPDIKNNRGDTPLHCLLYAPITTNFPLFDLVKMMVGASGDPLITNRRGRTALHILSQSATGAADSEPLMQLLLQKIKNDSVINLRDNQGNTCLHIFMRTSRQQNVLVLLHSLGADLNIENNEGATILSILLEVLKNTSLEHNYAYKAWGYAYESQIEYILMNGGHLGRLMSVCSNCSNNSNKLKKNKGWLSFRKQLCDIIGRYLIDDIAAMIIDYLF